MVRTATMAPEMFDNGGMEMRAVVLRPLSARRWELLLALKVPSSLVEQYAEAVDWSLGGVVRKPSATPLRRFRLAVDLAAPAVESATGDRWFFRRTTLRPGRYLVSTYVHNSAMDRPLAALQTIELPPVPAGSPFLVAPIVGLADDRVPRAWYGPVRPLPLAELAAEQAPVSLARICVVAPGPELPQTFVTRRLTKGPRIVEELPRQAVDLEPGLDLSCDTIVEPLPVDLLVPGDYLLEFVTASEDGRFEGRVEMPLLILESAQGAVTEPGPSH